VASFYRYEEISATMQVFTKLHSRALYTVVQQHGYGVVVCDNRFWL